MRADLDVVTFGQVFTPGPVVQAMLALRKNGGRVLEPSCGDGAFAGALPGCVALEIDGEVAPDYAQVMDFFAYPTSEQFDTIIGNPPYVRFQDIPAKTRRRLAAAGYTKLLDNRSSLYLYFMAKCLAHLVPGGELIFITPRDFLKASGAVTLNRLLFGQGSITDAIDLGDVRVFAGAVPNCLIWRFEKGNFHRVTRYFKTGFGADLATVLLQPPWEERHFVEAAGHLLFTHGDYPLHLGDIATVKVGAVSGDDAIYTDETHGNRDFVCSTTITTGLTRRMIWCEPGEPPPEALLPHKERLMARKVRAYHEDNWWHWGRAQPQFDAPRVYVNGRTRRAQPFFSHDCPYFDGSVLAVFPRRPEVDLADFAAALNAVDWADLGFICDGRFLFTQRSLANAPLPAEFARFLPDSLDGSGVK